jgi:CspA family cold shock protein
MSVRRPLAVYTASVSVLVRRASAGESDQLMQGTIRRIVSDRGFGFIAADTGTELFFHASSVEGGGFDGLHEGQRVDFTAETDQRGRGERAVHVRTVDG